MLEKSLGVLGSGFEKIIWEHYENAKSHGYMVFKDFS